MVSAFDLISLACILAHWNSKDTSDTSETCVVPPTSQGKLTGRGLKSHNVFSVEEMHGRQKHI